MVDHEEYIHIHEIYFQDKVIINGFKNNTSTVPELNKKMILGGL